MASPVATPSVSRSEDRRMQPNRAAARFVPGQRSKFPIDRTCADSGGQGGLDDSDRAYLAHLISTRTGLSPDEAQRRVSEVEAKAREAADKAAKVGAYVSFWTFMALLFGGMAVVLAGMLGGQLRDAEGRIA
jgi:hypothetical protein